MTRVLGCVLLFAFVGVAGCSEALRFVERKVACPELSVSRLQAALQGLTDWEVTPTAATSERCRYRWAGEVRRERTVSVSCKRGDREIHLELLEAPQILFLYTQHGDDLSASMRELYEALQANCEGLPPWDEMEEQRQGGEKYNDPRGALWAVGLFVVGAAVLFLFGIGVVANAIARGRRRPARHL